MSVPTVFSNPALVPALVVENIAMSSVVGLVSALGGKAATSHTHAQSEVTNLVADLSAKAAASHTHAQSEVTDLVTDLSGKAATSHTHAQSEVTNLVTDLSGKAASSHTHAQSQVTNLVSDLAAKAASSHTHIQSQITGLPDQLAALMPAPLVRTTEQGRPLDDEDGTSLAVSGTLDPDITSLIFQQVEAGYSWSSDGSSTPPISGLWALLVAASFPSPLGTWRIFVYQDSVYTGKSFTSYSGASPQAANWGYSATGGATGTPTVSVAETGGTPAVMVGRLCIVGNSEFWQCIRLAPVLWKKIAQAEDVMGI